MDEWTGIRQERYLRAIIARDSPDGTEECRSCSEQFSHWRCRDCLGNQALCRRCCRERHRDLPCHRIEFWTGTHYERDWLCNLGVVVHLGHHSLFFFFFFFNQQFVPRRIYVHVRPSYRLTKEIEDGRLSGVRTSPRLRIGCPTKLEDGGAPPMKAVGDVDGPRQKPRRGSGPGRCCTTNTVSLRRRGRRCRGIAPFSSRFLLPFCRF